MEDVEIVELQRREGYTARSITAGNYSMRLGSLFKDSPRKSGIIGSDKLGEDGSLSDCLCIMVIESNRDPRDIISSCNFDKECERPNSDCRVLRKKTICLDLSAEELEAKLRECEE